MYRLYIEMTMRNTLHSGEMFFRKIFLSVIFSILSISTFAQTPDFLISENPACLDGQTGFKIIRFFPSGDIADSTKWIFNINNLSEGSATTYGGQIAAITYNAPGPKTIRMTAYYNGVPSVVEKTVTLFNSPRFSNPGISALPSALGCTPLTVTFRPNLLNPLPAPIDSVFWFYGDGTADTVLNTGNIAHTYPTGKATGYDVFILVKDVNGCRNSFLAKEFVNAYVKPNAEFELTNTSSCTGSVTVGIVNTTTPAPLSNFNYSWEFPGGTPATSSSANPGTVFYSGTGKYVVRLTARNPTFGCESTFQSQDTIIIGQIIAGFNTNVSSICVGQNIVFTNTTNFQELRRYTLNFGGGAQNASGNGSFSTITRTFNTPGTYNVSLTVESLDGCTNTITKQITVFPRIKAGFRMPPLDSIGCSFPHTVNPINTSTGASQYIWKWGNGQTTNNLPFTYTSPPSTINTLYDVELVAISADGCRDSVKTQGAVFVGNPRFRLNSVTLDGCAEPGSPKKVNFEIQNLIAPVNAGAPNIVWTINGGVPSTFNGVGPIAVDYPNPGSYNLNIAFNYPNCPSFTKDTTINVAGKPVFTGAANGLSPDILCPNTDNVSATAFSAEPGLRYVWLHGDGNSSEGVTSSWGYSDPRINFGDPSIGFPVTLVASKFGCADSIDIGIARVDFPLATFNIETNCTNKNEITIRPEILTGSTNPKDVTVEWDYGIPGMERTYLNNQFPNPDFFTYPPGTSDFSITLTVTNPNAKFGQGCSNGRTITGRIVNPIPDVIITPREGCAPLSTDFRDIGPNAADISQWKWIFGTNTNRGDSTTTSVPRRAGVTYSQPGVFSTQLAIRDINNCVTRYNTGDVTVNQITPRIQDLPRGICPPRTLSLVNLTTVAIPLPSDTVQWFVNGALHSSNLNDVLDINTEGTFVVEMRYKGAYGCIGSVIDTVYSVDTRADFTPVPSQVCPGKPIRFINTSNVYRVIRYEWDFGDPLLTNDVSNERNPTWTYNRVGVFTVTLRVFDENGCQDVIQKDVKVAPLEVDFTANNRSITCPLLISRFTIEKLSPPDVKFKNVKWELDYKGFVEGRIIFDNESPIWVYTEGGKDDGFYNVRLSVEDSSGCVDTVTKMRYLFVGGPRADFSFDPKVACIPDVINFDNSFITNDVVSKFWDWGNGTTSQVFTGLDVKDQFYNFRYTDLMGKDQFGNLAETGIVRPLLIIDDQICDPVIIDRGVVRLSKLVSDFEASNFSLCDSGFVFVQNKSELFKESGDFITQYGWSVPRLNFTSSDSIINNLFLPDTGVYSVFFNIRSDFGCNKDTTFDITVLETPKIILPPPQTICLGDQITISAPGAVFYDWNPKISVINPDSSSPTFAPIETTTYKVFFYSNPECPNNDSLTVTVIRDLQAFAFPDAELCLGDSVQIFATIVVDTSSSIIKPTYNWVPPIEISDPSSPSPIVKPTQDRQYTVTISYGNCPDDSYTVTIDVGYPSSVIADEDKTIIRGQSTLLGATLSNPGLPVTWRPVETLDNPNTLAPLATPDVTTTYVVSIQDGACVSEDSMTIFVLEGCDGSGVRVPNVFTPNGDGKNDILNVYGKGISEIRYFRIYNRWGELVHESYSLDRGWDGTYNGKMANPGVYVYYLDVICVNGESTIVKGNVTLLR